MEENIREILDRTGKYAGLTSGTSMWPLLYDHRDNIIVLKPKGRLQKYDIALYETKDGKYIMHRVVEVHEDHYVIVGDHCITREYIPDEMICGVLAGFYRRGKHYVDCQNGKAQKVYARIWVALFPLRPAMLFAERGVRFIKRKILRIGK